MTNLSSFYSSENCSYKPKLRLQKRIIQFVCLFEHCVSFNILDHISKIVTQTRSL